MKKIEERAYSAALVRTAVVRYLVEELHEKLHDKSPNDRLSAEQLFRQVVERQLDEMEIADLAPKNHLSKKEFENHVLRIVKQVRKKAEDQLEKISGQNKGGENVED